jgi:lipase maturation factor 1
LNAGVAFLVAFHQNGALIGRNGLLPADKYLANVKRHAGDQLLNQLYYCPSLLLVFSGYDLDTMLTALSLVGLALASFILISGAANMLMMLTLWILYHSIVNVGQRWYVSVLYLTEKLKRLHV